VLSRQSGVVLWFPTQSESCKFTQDTRRLSEKSHLTFFDDTAAEFYAQIRAYLANSGTLIGPNDLQIAAIALANNLILVTHNSAEFGRVQNLRMEDWELP
jgi:predicted nucleic acid-binding protein